MKRFFCSSFALVLLAASTSFAQAPSTAPSGSTGACKDGSFTSAPSKRGACAGHKGVKDWYASADSTPATPAAPATTPTPATASAAPQAPASATKSSTASPARAPAAGGGPGQVWVNTASKVYHCQGSKYYGTTKAGEYMTEAAAKAAGDHADHGKKACTTS